MLLLYQCLPKAATAVQPPVIFGQLGIEILDGVASTTRNVELPADINAGQAPLFGGVLRPSGQRLFFRQR